MTDGIRHYYGSLLQKDLPTMISSCQDTTNTKLFTSENMSTVRNAGREAPIPHIN